MAHYGRRARIASHVDEEAAYGSGGRGGVGVPSWSDPCTLLTLVVRFFLYCAVSMCTVLGIAALVCYLFFRDTFFNF